MATQRCNSEELRGGKKQRQIFIYFIIFLTQ